MIYLIGGSSHVGKTFLAQKLLERFHIPTLSLDHLKMMFIRSHLTDLTVEDDYEMRYFLWPYAAELIKTAIENHQEMIIEGCYIPSEWRDAFREKRAEEQKAQAEPANEQETSTNRTAAAQSDPKDGANEYLNNIRAAFIVMSEAYLRNNLDDVTSYASVIEQRLADEVDLERLINCSKEFEEEAKQFHIPVLKIDKSFDPEELTNELARLLEMDQKETR